MNRRQFITTSLLGSAGLLLTKKIELGHAWDNHGARTLTPSYTEKIIPGGSLVLVNKNPNAPAPSVKWGRYMPADWEFLGRTIEPTNDVIRGGHSIKLMGNSLALTDFRVEALHPTKVEDVRQLMFIVKNKLTGGELHLVASDVELIDKVAYFGWQEPTPAPPKMANRRRFRALIRPVEYVGTKTKSLFCLTFFH